MEAGLDIVLLPLELAAWDAAPSGDALVVPIASDVLLLRGAAGLADWRLSGALSRALAQGLMTGIPGETMTFATHAKLPWKTLVAFGSGPTEAGERTSAGRHVQLSLEWAGAAGHDNLAIALPSWAGPAESAEALVNALAQHPGLAALTVLIAAPACKPLAQALRVARARPLPSFIDSV